MKISSRVEPLTRSAIHAAVQQDPSKLETALQALPDDQAVREAVELALAVTQLVLRDIHQGEPSDEEIRAVAAEIVRAEAWAHATDEQVSAFLLRLVKGEPFAGAVPTENVVILAIVSAANLLSSCRRDDEEWWNYLDRLEAALENA
ncbi:hypothetical protein AB0A95_00375 [Micromonospora sp. NPDC049230]|uniref:hypothetical protein n=1 Tax=Micromonospora sp. NPDC049230 TaxID=3155502 RepID=UPI0033DFBA68